LGHLRWVHEPSWSSAVHVLNVISSKLVLNIKGISGISANGETFHLIWEINIDVINVNQNGKGGTCLVVGITFLDDQRLVINSFVILIAEVGDGAGGKVSRCGYLTLFKSSHINNRVVRSLYGRRSIYVVSCSARLWYHVVGVSI